MVGILSHLERFEGHSGDVSMLCARHYATEHRELSAQGCSYPCALRTSVSHPALGFTGKSCSVVYTGVN